MNLTPLIRMTIPALVGLSLAPSAMAKSYYVVNHNKTEDDHWYLLVTRTSTGSIAGPDEYKGEFLAPDAPPAKQIFRFSPGARVRCTFGPDADGAAEYKVVFYLYDRNLKNGSFRFIEGRAKGGTQSVLIQQEVPNLDWECGNPDAVELRPMLESISMNLSTWEDKGGWKTSLVDKVDLASFDSVARDMTDPRPNPPAKGAHARIPSAFVRQQAADPPVAAAAPKHQRQSSLSIWVEGKGHRRILTAGAMEPDLDALLALLPEMPLVEGGDGGEPDIDGVLDLLVETPRGASLATKCEPPVESKAKG